LTVKAEVILSTITFVIGVGIRGPLEEAEYSVGEVQVGVSYPATVNLGLPTPIELPRSLSTLFVVSWDDTHGRTEARLRSNSFLRHLPIYDAIEAINELLLAFKMVRVGHADGRGIRTIGIGDTLFYFSKIDGDSAGDLNLGLKTYGRYYSWGRRSDKSLDDPLGTTPLAEPHIGTTTLPVARRCVRCYELLEHGFYSEAFIVAFSILDDVVQQMLHELLAEKGIDVADQRDELLRGIKERRLKLYLGPLLKVLCGKDLSALWPKSDSALDWLNRTRNKIAHGGQQADYATAAKAIFACIKTLVVLWQSGLVDAEFTVEIFRHAKITAAWTENAPDWIPSGELAESMDFHS
jgi:hypothetical protein